MNKKELLVEYINMRIQQELIYHPYEELLGEGLNNLQESYHRSYEFINKLLDIPEEWDEAIFDYVWHEINGRTYAPYWMMNINTVEELADMLLESI